MRLQVDNRVLCKELRFWSAPPNGRYINADNTFAWGECTDNAKDKKWSTSAYLSKYKRLFPPQVDGMIAGEVRHRTPTHLSSHCTLAACGHTRSCIRITHRRVP